MGASHHLEELGALVGLPSAKTCRGINADVPLQAHGAKEWEDGSCRVVDEVDSSSRPVLLVGPAKDGDVVAVVA